MKKENTPIIMFSTSHIGFYPKAWIEDGGYTNPPEDLIELTSEEVIEFRDGMPPEGKCLGVVDGRPAWVDSPSFTPPVEYVISQRQKLITDASFIIASLKDALEGGYIDKNDIPKLEEWQKYRYALTKVDVNDPHWPQPPKS